jgi:hypothetical protein
MVGLVKQYECRFSLANGMNIDEQLGIWKDKERKQQQEMQQITYCVRIKT